MSEAERENDGSPKNADSSADALANALADARPDAFSAGSGGIDNEMAGNPSARSRAADRL
jgi:hypothetical protein